MRTETPETNAGTVARAGARGLVGAMAMTGVRTVTAAVGPHEQSPPEAIVDQRLPVLRRVPERHQRAFTELLHWTYGTMTGAAYGMLPRRVRAHPASGPVYGLVAWLGFEIGMAPALGVRHVHEHGVAWRAGMVLDHLLYGVIVGGRLAPEPEPRRDRVRRAVRRAAAGSLGRRKGPGRALRRRRGRIGARAR
ncbi:MAG TPA: hypothetical protein VKY91_20135 [Vulgatibacteraceae bacterium]|nr:hypothetical protein [Vulgatibacteraceae bacterium]